MIVIWGYTDKIYISRWREHEEAKMLTHAFTPMPPQVRSSPCILEAHHLYGGCHKPRRVPRWLTRGRVVARWAGFDHVRARLELDHRVLDQSGQRVGHRSLRPTSGPIASCCQSRPCVSIAICSVRNAGNYWIINLIHIIIKMLNPGESLRYYY
jgi:hypothetical protein